MRSSAAAGATSMSSRCTARASFGLSSRKYQACNADCAEVDVVLISHEHRPAGSRSHRRSRRSSDVQRQTRRRPRYSAGARPCVPP
jgi:hypothetical protein